MSSSLFAACATHEPWRLQAGQHPQVFERTLTVKAQGKFLLFLPAGFHQDARTRYPLLIFLHGSDESGEDIEKVKANGPPKLVASQPDFPFIVASPQATSDVDRFDPLLLDAMLDELLERLPIDPDRVYLTGLSLGGMWTYGWSSLRPERFAALAPMSGEWNVADACRIKHIPVWAFHGAKDDVVPIGRDQAMVDAINACGGSVRFTVYPDAGHDAWTRAYDDPELYRWLLQQRRNRSAAAQ